MQVANECFCLYRYVRSMEEKHFLSNFVLLPKNLPDVVQHYDDEQKQESPWALVLANTKPPKLASGEDSKV